jgi:integrase
VPHLTPGVVTCGARTRSGVLSVPKSGKVRSVPMIDHVARALDCLSWRELFTEADDLVFGSEVGAYMDESALRRRFKASLERAELKPIRFHDLRHSFGTLAVQAFPLSDVKAYMGHADISTTMIYVHHVPKHDAAERLSRLVAASDGFAGQDEHAALGEARCRSGGRSTR